MSYLGYRFVADTNLIISRLLLPDSKTAEAFIKAQKGGDMLVSDSTLSELAQVLARPKFDKYLSPEDRKRFFTLIAPLCIKIDIVQTITACRDPKDNKFLELAINGSADFILSGDKDLLAIHPFQGIPIYKPAQYLELENYT